jgi:hypothetical protein
VQKWYGDSPEPTRIPASVPPLLAEMSCLPGYL